MFIIFWPAAEWQLINNADSKTESGKSLQELVAPVSVLLYVHTEKPSGLLGTGARVQCFFTSTESIRLIRDGEPRTAISTFTQLLNSESSVPAFCISL